jgi:hypothetical protein
MELERDLVTEEAAMTLASEAIRLMRDVPGMRSDDVHRVMSAILARARVRAGVEPIGVDQLIAAVSDLGPWAQSVLGVPMGS